jgi:hypothetical protein
MVPLVGYTDRFSAAPGQEIAFKVSRILRNVIDRFRRRPPWAVTSTSR